MKELHWDKALMNSNQSWGKRENYEILTQVLEFIFQKDVQKIKLKIRFNHCFLLYLYFYLIENFGTSTIFVNRVQKFSYVTFYIFLIIGIGCSKTMVG
jgi:hypothetical protein